MKNRIRCDEEKKTVTDRVHRCRICQSKDLRLLQDFGRTPIAHRLLKQRDETAELFPFAVQACQGCGLVQTRDPIPAEILYRDFNYNFSSWKVEPHIEDELDLITRDGVPASICEIGANDGRFLELLRERGASLCVGIEPNRISGQRARERGFEIYGEFLDDALAKEIRGQHGPFDLVIFRQVMEHIHDPRAFLTTVRSLLREGGRVFVDVPDFAPTRALGDCTTFWEEHVLYFTENTLKQLFSSLGFKPVGTAWYDFSGGCLAMLMEMSEQHGFDFSGNPEEIDANSEFPNRLDDYRKRLSATLRAHRDQGTRVAVYGAGVRAVAVANFLGMGSLIDMAIDDQVERQGLFIPSAVIPIRPLADLSGDPFVMLLAVNNESENKVSAKAGALPGARAVIAPTFAALTDAAAFAEYTEGRRRVFTDKLLLPPLLFEGQEVLEFGPDTGENALVFAKWGARMTLCEPNPRAHPQIREYFEKFGVQSQLLEINQADVVSYQAHRDFDVIIAEGFIYTVQPTELWLCRLSSCLKDEGLAIISYYEKTGAFLELVLKVILAAYRRQAQDDPVLAARDLFQAKWDSIPHTRQFESWVRDVLVNPFVRLAYFLDSATLLEEAVHENLALYASWPVYRQPLQPYWHKRVLSQTSETERDKSHLHRSRLSFLLGDMAYLTLGTTEMEVINKTVDALLLSLDRLIDTDDADALMVCLSTLETLRKVLSEGGVLVESTDALNRADSLLASVHTLLSLIQTGEPEQLRRRCNEDTAFIAAWGMPTHYAVLRRMARP